MKYSDNGSKFCRLAQKMLSSTASNYDMPRLVIGVVLGVLAILASLIATYIFVPSMISLLPIALISSLYTVMMFASSYVEEEQHFWYWLTAGWVTLFAWQR